MLSAYRLFVPTVRTVLPVLPYLGKQPALLGRLYEVLLARGIPNLFAFEPSGQAVDDQERDDADDSE